MGNNIKFEDKITDEFKSKLDALVLESKSIVITSHFSPDDDSISSVLSVYYYLVNYLKIENSKLRIVYTGEKNEKWNSLANFDKINFVDDLFNHVNNHETLIVLDGGSYKRFSRKEEMEKFSGKTICIDHHPIPGNKFDLQLVAKQYTSTTEIVYRLLYQGKNMSKEICEILLLGIVGDTGSFRFINNTTAGVLSIAERLVVDGKINVDSFIGQFEKINKNSYQILIELMKNSKIKKIKNWPEFVCSYIDMNKCIKLKYTDNDVSEGSSYFTRYLRVVNGVEWGMVITPRLHDMTHSVSFRSSPGSVVTREIGETMGIGGGHDRASGGKLLTRDTKNAIKKILDWMKKNKPSFS